MNTRRSFAVLVAIAMAVMVLVGGCRANAAPPLEQAEPVTIEVTRVVEATVVVEVPVEVPVEVERIVEVEKEVIREVPVTVTPIPTPTATPNPLDEPVGTAREVFELLPLWLSEVGMVTDTVRLTMTAGLTNVIPSAQIQHSVEAYTIVETEEVNDMVISWTDHAMKDRGDGITFYVWAKAEYPDWPAVEPAKWPTAPNVPNPMVDWFRVVNGDEVPDGVEIPDTGERNYCQLLEGEWCTNVVAPGHYMVYTGDGFVPSLWIGMGEAGHVFSYWNVGNVESRLDGVFLQGWRLTGRYWNGDTLPFAIVGVHGHAANNMHDLEGKLNPSGSAFNAGGNCGVPGGCDEVQHTAVIGSGNAPLVIITFLTSK